MTTRRTLLTAGAAVLLLAGLVACSGTNDTSSATGGILGGGPIASGHTALTVKIHDDPGTMFSSAFVTFSSLEVHVVDGDWVAVSGTFPMTVDLLTLVNGKTATLAAGSVPAGTYDRIRVTVTGAEVTLLDGTKITVTMPPGGVTVERAVSFTAVEGEPITITLDFPVGSSFRPMGMGYACDPDLAVESVEQESRH